MGEVEDAGNQEFIPLPFIPSRQGRGEVRQVEEIRNGKKNCQCYDRWEIDRC
jgi:hypothetical protein